MDRSRNDHAETTATAVPAASAGLIVSIEDAAAWQRSALHDGGDFSTPARALPLTGRSELNPLASDSSRRSGAESARSSVPRSSFHSHSRSMDDKLLPPLPAATHRRGSSSLDKDDSALNALNTKETEGALLHQSEQQPPQQPHQQHEQHCPLEPTATTLASGSINASTAVSTMLKSMQSRAGSAHQLGQAEESVPRPTQPLRFASEPSVLLPSQPLPLPPQQQQQDPQQSHSRADTPRPAPLPDSDCSSVAAIPSASATAIPAAAAPAVPTVRRGSLFDISHPRAPVSYLDEHGVERSKQQHRRKESEDLRAEGPPLLCTPPIPASQKLPETVHSNPGSADATALVPAPTPAPVAVQAPSKNLRIFLHETEVGRNLMLSRLCSGGIFLKLGARGSPHYRLVRVTPDLLSVSWTDLKHTEKVRGSIPVLSISRVDRGHASKLFRDRAPKSSVAMHCFSLRCEARTLDLECCSQEEADLWVLAFGFLIEYTQKRKRSMPAEETASQLRSDEEISVDRSTATDDQDLSTASVHHASSSSCSTSTTNERSRRCSISIVSALDVLCDHTRMLSEPNTPQTNSDLALLTGQENYSSDDLLPALPPEIMFDPALNPCRAATAAASIASSSSSESICSSGSSSAATASASSALVPPLLPASGTQLDADATSDVHLLTQCLPLSMARQIDSSLDATLDGGELSLEIDAAPPKAASAGLEQPKSAAEAKVLDPVLPPPIRVPLPPVAEVDDASSTAAPASTAGLASVTAATMVPEATGTVERLTTAPSSFPDQAPSAKEVSTSTEPAARSPHQSVQQALSSSDQAAQLQREFHKLSELNQQANRIYTPILPDSNAAPGQQLQPPLPNFPLCFPGGRLSTGSAVFAPTGCAAGSDVACQTPFLLDPAQFAQQDIFDLSTFAHLAAETAAEYGRALPKEQFEEMHAAATAAAAAAAANAEQGADATSNVASSVVPVPSVAPQSGLSSSQLRALHDREVAAYIAADARLSRIHRNLCKYRAEYRMLEESSAVKLARLQMELRELQGRNEKLRRLHEKMRVTTKEKQAFRTSLATLPPRVSASASPHVTHNHTPGAAVGAGSWTQQPTPLQPQPGGRVGAAVTSSSTVTPTFASPSGVAVAAIL